MSQIFYLNKTIGYKILLNYIHNNQKELKWEDTYQSFIFI